MIGVGDIWIGFRKSASFFFCVCVWLQHTGMQFPHQESNPGSPAVEARSLNHWTTRDVPASFFL